MALAHFIRVSGLCIKRNPPNILDGKMTCNVSSETLSCSQTTMVQMCQDFQTICGEKLTKISENILGVYNPTSKFKLSGWPADLSNWLLYEKFGFAIFLEKAKHKVRNKRQFKPVVLKVVDIDPQGSIGPTKGSINSDGVEWGSLNGP